MDIQKEKFYSLAFSELAAVSVRRLAWALGRNMRQAVDCLVLCMPSILDKSKVCAACKDNTKCQTCIFDCGAIPPITLLDLLRNTTPPSKELAK